MDLVVNILLAISGLGATLAAFGGDTWIKGAQPLVTRITYRGWVSLCCISVAFGIGIYKEVRDHNREISKIALENELKIQATEKQEKIDAQVTMISDLQRQISQSQKKVSRSAESLITTTERLGEQQLSSIEAAFALAVKSPREMDDWVVNLNGQQEQVIPSRLGGTMLLYWGDVFDYTFVPPRMPRAPRKPETQASSSERAQYRRKLMRYEMRVNLAKGPAIEELASLKLVAGDREYSLHDGVTKGASSKSIRIYGDSPDSMEARILNPRKLTGVKIKIFVRSTDSTRGQKEFRKLVMNSAFSEFAKKNYRMTTADVLRMRERPNASARILSQLPHGSFLKVIQTSNGWSEVLTPQGRQGWVASGFIAQIN